MEDKRIRILETAIDLAEQGGFEAVRLRDVAAQADVALGTLYKRFRSKEDLLIGALELEAEKLDRRMSSRVVPGETQVERAIAFFEIVTRALFRKPNLGRAVLRAMTSGNQELTVKVASFHSKVTNLMIAAMRGVKPSDLHGEPTQAEQLVAYISQQIWFAALVGWMGGLHTKETALEQLRVSLEILIRGVEKET
jgi:AcrR family transcriptional regulator